ncbi:hypothetical protein T12_4995 [Trichinella patagoniensis]|uniref:Uncharacterized protein n=1 Tax=Trichinella patagoniensis TaxID=990121 RepID=A0A0V0Z4T8_9BILA|nr:hypothetical protein T12_4995 [Trichinella patagoniensis]
MSTEETVVTLFRHGSCSSIFVAYFLTSSSDSYKKKKKKPSITRPLRNSESSA